MCDLDEMLDEIDAEVGDVVIEDDPVCYCGELKSQHKGWNQDHGFVASPENYEDS